MSDEIDITQMPTDELLELMMEDLYDGYADEVGEEVVECLSRGMAPYEVLTQGLVAGMDIVGVDFRDLRDGAPDKLKVITEGDRGVDTSLQEDGCDPVPGCPFELADHVVDAVRVFPLLAGMPVEGAEDAVDVADVGVVGIGVHHECDPGFRVLPEADGVREVPQLEEFPVPEKEEPLLLRDPLPAADPGGDLRQARHVGTPDATCPESFRNSRIASFSRSPSV